MKSPRFPKRRQRSFPAAEAPVVVTRELTKKYGSLTALDRLSISLNRGEILGFIGPNGAGKTTTIKILVGLSRPTSGSATIAGVDCVRQARKIKRLVGYMPDAFGSYDNMRVWEYLDFFGAAFGIGRRERIRRIEEVMELTGSRDLRDHYVEALSHGMKQRIGIARTLLHDPQVLIMDEPANGLDPQARIEMRRILLQLAGSGKTLIVTSHILPELSRICDRVAILLRGRLRAFGSLEEIARRVSQRRTIEAQLSGPGRLAAAVEVIRREIGPEEEVVVSEAESVVRFATERSEEELGRLLAGLIEAGVPVTQFREVQSDLEDAFLKVAGEAEQADEEGKAPSGASGGAA